MSGLPDIEIVRMKDVTRLEIRNRLLMTRSACIMSQAELAQRSGVARQTINAVERAGQIPSLLTALKIADTLGVSVDEIFYLYKPKQ